jgi:hypothetical protein
VPAIAHPLGFAMSNEIDLMVRILWHRRPKISGAGLLPSA